MAKTFFKQPAEIVDYYVDMSDYFKVLDTDFIASTGDIVVTISGTDAVLEKGPGTLPETVLVNDPADGFKVWIGAGTDGVKYKVTCVVTTNVGRVEEIEFYVKVKET